MTDTVRVPREPTDEMRLAGADVFIASTRPGGSERQIARRMWEAMLAASPQGKGSSGDTHPPQPDALPGDLREKVAAIIDANKYEAWTVDRANQMADAILSLIQSERGGG